MTRDNDPATPTRVRAVASYPARRNYKPGIIVPPAIAGVRGAIDVHVHANDEQQDPVALAKLASISGMGGLLYKTLGAGRGRTPPAEALRRVKGALRAWADEEKIQPVECWAGYGLTRESRSFTAEKLRANLQEGVVAVWLPIANHANTLSKVGGKPIWWDKTADPKAHTNPLPWDEALRYGVYMLNDNGRLKPEFEEAVRIVADAGRALFFGHATHREIWVVAELVAKLGMKRAVIDHPYSPFVDLSIAQMKELASAGIFMNFTYDEISPLLGVDPAKIYEAIRAVGVEHCTLSSDAGDALFPNSVECMRLLRGHMESYGMNEQELAALCIHNPAKIVGLEAA